MAEKSTSFSKSQPKKPKAEVKDSLDMWLGSLGADLPPEKLKSMQEQVKINPKLAFYLQYLKTHSRPRAEAKRMQKLYLYKAINNGELKADLPDNVMVTCNRDVELLRKYTKPKYKTEALELVKIPEAVKELEKSKDILMKKNRQLRHSTETFVNNTGHLQLLTSTHANLNKIYNDLRKIKDCFEAFTRPEKGSDKLKKFLAIEEEHIRTIEKILSVSCAHIDRRDRKQIYPLIIECYKKILGSDHLKNVVECNPKRYFASVMSSSLLSGSENSRTAPLKPQQIMDNMEKFKFLITTIKNLKILITNYFEGYEKFALRNSQLLLKVNSIDESVQVLNSIKNNLETKSQVNTTFLTTQQFVTIEQVFNKWGEDVESSEEILSDCIIRKRKEYENCQLLIRSMSDISSRQFSIDFNYEDLDTFMNGSLVKFTKYSVNIPDLIKTNKSLGIEILKLLKSMSFYKINDVPITKIMQDIKQTIVDDKLARIMPIE